MEKLKFIFLEIPCISPGIPASQVHLPIMQHFPHKAKFILTLRVFQTGGFNVMPLFLKFGLCPVSVTHYGGGLSYFIVYMSMKSY